VLAVLTIFSSSREVWEQSLSRRDDLPESIRLLLPENSVQPANPPTEPSKEPEAEPLKNAAGSTVGKGSNVNLKQVALNFVVGISSSLFAASIFQDLNLRSLPATNSTTSTSSTSSADQNAQDNSYKSTDPPGSTLTPQSGQTQYIEYRQYPSQQRAVDHGKRADSESFGEPHSSHGL
jgi:hypothetical protein